MKLRTAALNLAFMAMLAASSTSQAAGHVRGGGSVGWHHGGAFHGSVSRGHVGIVLGAPLLWPGYYSPPVYYPPVVAVPAAPTAYIEQSAPQSSSNWWYYCRESQAYYPYVSQCAGAWERVAPQPAS